MRIVRMANFVTGRSGGLRTALRHLGAGYATAGHEPVLVVPGTVHRDENTIQGRVITLPGTPVPGSGGYRVLLGRRRLTRLLDDLAPDRLEVSDRSTLRWAGAWARARDVPSVMVSHESLAGLLRMWRVPDRVGVRFADALNARTAASYDLVVCTTGWAAREFRRIDVPHLRTVPLGVDPDEFHPGRHDPRLRARYAAAHEVLIVHCSRLSPEKRPDLPVEALRMLRRHGVPAVLVVIGDGPLRRSLTRRAAGLPVRFLGYLTGRGAMAAHLASADVAIAPGPIETFGLAALEALACGTPVVVAASSALPEVVGDAGVAVHGDPITFAAGIRTVLARPEPARRAAAHARAREFGWPNAVAGFLAAHGLPAPALGGVPVTTFVALGDSITVGMGDPMPDSSWRGWAALLAEGLAAPVDFHNLATSGALATDVAARQLPAALALRPDMAGVIAGVNDTLRASFDVSQIGAALAHTVATLRGAGARVLTIRLPDPGRMFGLPAALARPLARRTRTLNAVVDAIALRHGTLHFDAAEHPSTYDRRMWSVDRLHPSERGHRLIAGSYHDLLVQAGARVGRRPSPEPTNAPPRRTAQARWLATKGVRWLYDRSTDLVPYLLAMTVAEWWHSLRGAMHELDESARREVETAVDRVVGRGQLAPVATVQSSNGTRSGGQRLATSL